MRLRLLAAVIVLIGVIGYLSVPARAPIADQAERARLATSNCGASPWRTGIFNVSDSSSAGISNPHLPNTSGYDAIAFSAARAPAEIPMIAWPAASGVTSAT